MSVSAPNESDLNRFVLHARCVAVAHDLELLIIMRLECESRSVITLIFEGPPFSYNKGWRNALNPRQLLSPLPPDLTELTPEVEYKSSDRPAPVLGGPYET